MMGSRTFLVPSGYNFRAVLAFCRALRRAGARPAVIACTGSDPVFRTRFAADVVFTRASRALGVAEFAAATDAACRRDGVPRCVLAPSSEYLVRWAYNRRAELAVSGCDLPLPDESVYATVTDKGSFTKFARDHGLPVPWEFSGADRSMLPFIAKPRHNIDADGRSLHPWLLRTEFDLERFRAEERQSDFFFQEWIEGRSFYLLFHLPEEGEATIYSQENLAQQPGGKSIVCARGASLHETDVARIWACALKAAGFHGVAMIELRQRGGEFVLIEANPRLWGPLQLCLDGCPALLMNYIAGQTGIVPPKMAMRGAKNPGYLWLGGLGERLNPDWHEGAARLRAWEFLRRPGSDVYLRPGSWRQFFHEWRESRIRPVRAAVPSPVCPISS